MRKAFALLLCVAAVSFGEVTRVVVPALTATPVIAWSSFPAIAPTLHASESVSDLAAHLRRLPTAPNTTFLFPKFTSLSKPLSLLVVIDTSKSLTSATLRASTNLTAVLPAARVELPFTSGVPSHSSVLDTVAKTASFESKCSAQSEKVSAAEIVTAVVSPADETQRVGVICVKDVGSEEGVAAVKAVADGVAGTTKSYVVVVVGTTPEGTVELWTRRGTTVWTGPVISVIFSMAFALAILIFGINLLCTLQTQAEAEVPKQKTL